MQGGTRVYCLYRVSLSRQADRIQIGERNEADIPMQRDACRKFCNEHGWEIVNSITEPGVSGYKTPTFERYAIQEILSEAKTGNYDILLVYTIDRLSRRDYELPMLVAELKNAGVTVWSVQDGEIPFGTSMDHLQLFMHGWKAYGESERISQRITTIQNQLVMRGEFRGGTIPYGYKLIESGEISKQGKARHIMVAHEPEAAVVRMIFHKIADEGYSMYELTRFLCKMERPEGTRKMIWRSATLHDMLRNRIYIGQQRIRNEYSLPFERLQIVEPATFMKVQDITVKAQRSLPGKCAEVEPAPLYHDLIFCAHCGGRLVYNHAFDKRKDGSYSIRYYYRCYNRERFIDPCNGASTFSAKQIDASVRDRTGQLINFLVESPADALIRNSAELARSEYLAQRDSMQQKLTDLDEQLETLQRKLTDMLRLYGIETTSELQLVYQDIRDKRNAVLYALQKMQSSAYEMDHLLKVKEKVLQKIIRECEKWRRKSWKEAEAMTSRFFERIDVHKGYFLDYRIIPEIKQFLPVTQRLGDKTFSSDILHVHGCQTVLPTDASARL